MLTTVILTIVAFLVGGALSYGFFKYGLKTKYDTIIKEAETEAEVIKKNKLLEVKEKFLNKKADLEKEVAQRNQKIQQAENKLKQREMVLNQKNEELQRKRNETEAIKENLDAQLVIIEKKKEELDNLQAQEREKLETISGLSAEEAKERLVESLKEEAKTQAQSYINDIMDDAKFEARKENMLKWAAEINKKYGEETVTVELKDQYYNMREKIEPVMHIIDIAFKAMEEAGVTPKVKAIRGGTDGAQLSFKGLPCPNIFAGGLNFHGRYEFAPIQSLEKAMMVVVKISELVAR